MAQVTKAMLEERAAYLRRQLNEKETEISHLHEIIKLLKSPYTAGGYLAALAVAAEKLGDAMAHVVGDLKRRT